MNAILSFTFSLILAIGNFIPSTNDDIANLILKLITIILLIFIFSTHQHKKILDTNAIIFFVVITFIFIISFFRTNDLDYSLNKYISCSFVVLSLYLIFKILIVLNKNNFIQVTQYIVYAGLIILALTILYKIQFGFWNRDVRFFLNGPIVFSWLSGFYCLLSANIYKNTRKFPYLIICILFLFSVIWTESKGGLVATITALIFFLIYDNKNLIRLPIIGLIGLFFIFTDFVINILDSVTGNTRLGALIRLLNNNVAAQDNGSITIRQNMVDESIKLFNDNWGFGIGLSNYQFQTVYGFLYPHNIHLEIFLECGILIGLSYIIFIAINFIKAPTVFKSIFILFLIAATFSGDVTNLRFLLIICLICYAIPKNKFKITYTNSN